MTLATGTVWPYYVPKDGSYEHQARHVREEANLQILAVAPLVDDAELSNWNRFAQFHHNRLNLSSVPLYYYNKGIPTPYTDVRQNPNNSSLHAPMWLLSPPPKEPKVINYDILSSPEAQNLFQAMLQAPGFGTSVMSEILDFTRLQETAYQHDNESLMLPHSLIFQPIYNTYHDRDGAEPSPQPVGILFGIMYWHSFLFNLLPNTTHGIIAQFQNTCGQSIQYQLNADSVTFLGSGAAQKPPEPLLSTIPFSSSLVSSSSTKKMAQDLAASTSTNTAARCDYTLYVSASSHLVIESGSTESTIAAVYTFVVATVFSLGIIIVLYSIHRMIKALEETTVDGSNNNHHHHTGMPTNNDPYSAWNHTHDDDDDDQDPNEAAESLLDNYSNNLKSNNSEMGDKLAGLKALSNHRTYRRRPSMSQQRQESVSSFGMESGGGLDRSGGGGGMDGSGKSHATSKGSRDKKNNWHKNPIVNEKIKAAKEAARIESLFGSSPIADLFPESTVLFADIVGKQT